MDKVDLMDKHQERMCELCEDCIYGQKMNTGPYNLCEGSMCKDAFELLLDELNEEKYEKRIYLLIG